MKFPMLLTLLIGLTMVTDAPRANAHPGLNPKWKQFQKTCRANRAGHTSILSPPLTKGDINFIPTKALEAGQARFSFDRLIASMKKMAKKENLSDHDMTHRRFHHADGLSLYPKNRAIAGVLYRGKLYITDGHHRALISTYVGAEKVPVQIIDVADDNQTPEEFLKGLENLHLSYFKDYLGNSTPHVDLCEMENDLFLMLARQFLARVDIEKSDDQWKVTEVRGSKVAIAIKINRDLPFLEFELADKLRRAGVRWRPGDVLTNKKLKRFLEILEKDRDGSRLKEVLLLPEPANVAELNLQKLVGRHLDRYRCEYQLMSSDQD